MAHVSKSSSSPPGQIGHSQSRSLTAIERFSISLGAQPTFVESVFGDLAEERALREGSDGRPARAWYAWQVARSMPHLLWNGARHGSRAAHLRLAGLVAAVLTVIVVASIAIASRSGPPARLVAGSANVVVVNGQRPVQLPMRVLDASGRSLDSSGVAYEWLNGAALTVSGHGVVTCSERGDAMVRATLEGLAADVRVHCRPVQKVRGPWMLELVAGDRPTEIPFEALGIGGERETMLTGRLSVRDSSVATLNDQQLVARKSGSTFLTIRIGDETSDMSVHVFEPALSPERMVLGEHRAIPVRLSNGEVRRWQLAPAHELYYIAMRPDGRGGTPPNVAVVGAQCTREPDPHSFYCVAVEHTSVIVYSTIKGGQSGDQSGRLLVWLQPR